MSEVQEYDTLKQSIVDFLVTRPELVQQLVHMAENLHKRFLPSWRVGSRIADAMNVTEVITAQPQKVRMFSECALDALQIVAPKEIKWRSS